jgi:hypothetical protein
LGKGEGGKQGGKQNSSISKKKKSKERLVNQSVIENKPYPLKPIGGD